MRLLTANSGTPSLRLLCKVAPLPKGEDQVSVYKHHCECHRLTCHAEVSGLWKLHSLGCVVQRQPSWAVRPWDVFIMSTT